VSRVLARRGGAIWLEVALDGATCPAVAYAGMVPALAVGDEVLVNTTAVDLGLGTGGWHFVVAAVGGVSGCGGGGSGGAGGERESSAPGHVMKLRYTPLQVRCLCAEAPESPHHAALRDARDIAGMTVVCGELHSQLAPFAAALGALGGRRARLVYVMTDGGALPAPFSHLLAELRERGLVAATVTAGHAFGGDIEAVNLYSGLLAARHVAAADIAFVGPGPGVVGTGTAFGTTALDQGLAVDAAATLGGRPVAALRIAFGDARPGHRGVSHHALTALGVVAHASAELAVPLLPPGPRSLVLEQLRAAPGMARHRVVEADGAPAARAMREMGLGVTSMGRDVDGEPALFQAAGAAAAVALRGVGSGAGV